MVTTVESANKINPHMKFTPPANGVVNPPTGMYKYSMQSEIQRGDELLKQVNASVKRRRLRDFAKDHPNLKSNIWGVIKLTTLVLGSWMGFRYRHSIPVLKDICKVPTKPIPDFKRDMTRIWNNIRRTFNK